MRLDLVELGGEEVLEGEVGQLSLVLPQPEPRGLKAAESAASEAASSSTRGTGWLRWLGWLGSRWRGVFP